jgi:electron-transferring-flavoprotein dehydrogenase
MATHQLGQFKPRDYQPAFPLEQFIVNEQPGEDAVPLDVLIVGGGPAGLAAAIQLAKLAKEKPQFGSPEIGVLEKAQTLGGHCLSGAVVNPIALRQLFPELKDADFPFRGKVERDRVYLLTKRGKWRLPTPQTMNNHDNYLCSICELVRWLGVKAEELGVNIMTGYPAAALLADGRRIIGARTAASGLARDGTPGSSYVPPTDLAAKITILAEGTRGSLTRAYLEREKIASQNPQIYALGVKELWRVKQPLDAVIHTLGWPLPRNVFGGSWIYPMGDDTVSLGIVAGLDYPQRTLDVHDLLQQLKTHPMVREILAGGELLEWGAKTIPEGGFYALPERFSGDGILIAGDAAGFVDVASLKGIHYAMQSGVLAGRAAFDALTIDKPDADELASYDRTVRDSFIYTDLHKRRNMRLAFKSGFYVGGAKSMLMTLTGGKFPGGQIKITEDADVPRINQPVEHVQPDGKLTFSKVEAVYRADNGTRDDVPTHVIAADNVPREVGEFYAAMCPAGVYEWQDGKLIINAPNCVDCKATDVLGPLWTPREGGSGPNYKQM